jgi:putative acetyltransferase
MRWSIPLPLMLGWVLLVAACNHRESGPVAIRADRTASGASGYPVAVDTGRVGAYQPETESGGGYFYDDVLEYRVWLHPGRGAARVNGGDDYFVAFAQYERADAFAKSATGADPPLVLVRQIEWIDEPAPRHFVPENGERLTEWQVRWLRESKRTASSVTDFMKHPPSSEK